MRGPRSGGVLLVLCVSSLSLLSAQPTALAQHGVGAPRVGRIPLGTATPGAELWVQRYKGPGNGGDVARAMGASLDDSKVFVTGYSTGSTSSLDFATAAYDGSTGAQLWAQRYNGPGNSNDYANALGVSPDGSEVFVTGSSAGSTSNFDYATAAYDASTGTQMWVNRYTRPGPDYDTATALGVSPDGSKVFVTGSGTGSTSRYDYATVAYDASTGAKLWVKSYNGPADGDDVARALAVSPDGSTVFVTGYSTVSALLHDYATVAYDASTGAKLWVTRYNGPANGDDVASALGLSPDGSKVFVTGYNTGLTSGLDYATVAYDAFTGAKLWVTRYKGPGNGDDAASALAASPGGSTVFVTGYSSGSTVGVHYATLAYVVG